MQALSSTLLSHLQSRDGLISDLLIWVTGINRSTSALESVGFWTGPTDATFSIDGQTRTFHGIGAIVSVPAMISEVGLSVRAARLGLNPVQPDVINAIESYDLRLQPIQLYVAYSQGVSGNLIDDPVLRFDGVVAGQPISEGAPGEAKTLELMLLSSAHRLTRPLHVRKSDAALIARHTGDRFRRYIDVSGVVETVWGTGKGKAPAGAASPSTKQTYRVQHDR